MSIAIHTDPVPLTMDKDGTIRVRGTRMTLDLIIAERQAGAAPEQIAADYDSLSLGDVYAAITYYLHHQDEIDAYLQQRRRALEELRHEVEEKHPREGRRERLLARAEIGSDRMATAFLSPLDPSINVDACRRFLRSQLYYRRHETIVLATDWTSFVRSSKFHQWVYLKIK